MLKKILRSPITVLRRLYDWTIHWATTPQATIALFCVAFIESSFFPIPPDVLLIAMVMANRDRWLKDAMICTIGSVLGACFGYFIGWGLYETVGKFVVQTYHLEPMMELVGKKYAENAFLTVFTAAFTPIPYKIITIGAGLFKISLQTLVVASIFGRAGRFLVVAGALRLFGKKIERTIEKYFDIISLLFMAGLIGGYIAIKYWAH